MSGKRGNKRLFILIAIVTLLFIVTSLPSLAMQSPAETTRDAYAPGVETEAHSFTDCDDTECNDEGCAYTRQALAHSGGVATCTDLAACASCGKRYGELLPHTPSDGWVISDTHHYRRCEYWNEYSSCNEIYDDAEHTFGEWTVTREGGYFELGEKQRSCVCGKIETESTQMKSILDEPFGKRELAAIGALALGVLALWGVAYIINRP